MLEARNFIEEIINKDIEEGKIETTQTRFPPEPNGYLHIGHAKAICINFGIKEKYHGKCNLRFDDTNPTKEDVEYVDAIKEDIKWLGFSWDRMTYASDFFDQIYEKAVLLIKKGLAYVCDLSAEEIKEYRGTLSKPGKESPYRNRSIEENLDLFTRMKNGEFADGEKVLRAKIDMASPNINMRDPVIYRILHATHHRTGDKWCIYPMYDFTHPLCDAFEGITHSLCSLEFEDHRPLYEWSVDNCDFVKKPKQREFARLNITKSIMSKRYLKKLVEDGKVDGWDDPRMPTLCGLRRRGYTGASIKDFCERIGVAKANSELDIRNLEACIREELNLTAPRVMAVLKPLKVELTNFNGEELLDVDNNPNAEHGGTRKVAFSKDLYIDADDFSLNPPPKYHRLVKGGTVRLKGAYIIKCDDVVTGANGEIEKLICSVVPNSKSGDDTSGVKVKGVIQFVEANTAKKVTVKRFDYLLLDEAYDGQDFEERFNDNSLEVFNALIEGGLPPFKAYDRFQFMRIGYFTFDDKNNCFNETVGLKDTFNK